MRRTSRIRRCSRAARPARQSRETVLDDAELVGHGQVGRQHCADPAVRAGKLLRDRFEPAFVARDEHEVVAPFGKQTGERLTDSERRASDEGDGSMSRMPPGRRTRECTSRPFTTMRSAALCFGWHANSVSVGVVVG